MAEPFDTLMQVQEHDTTLDQLRHRKETLPERAALAERGPAPDRAGPVGGRDPGTRWTTWPADSGNLEEHIAATAKRRHEIEQRMQSGEVSASRDLQAMDHEVHQLPSASPISRRRSWPCSRSRSRSTPGWAERPGRRWPPCPIEADRLTAAIAEAEADIGGVHRLPRRPSRETELAPALPAELAQRYELLRSRLGGVGAARLVGDRCDGCHLTLPSVEVERIRHLPPEEFATCPQCDRILVH